MKDKLVIWVSLIFLIVGLMYDRVAEASVLGLAAMAVGFVVKVAFSIVGLAILVVIAVIMLFYWLCDRL